MPGEGLTNAVVEGYVLAFDALNSTDEAPGDDFFVLADDFVLEDRRTGGASAGRLDASEFISISKAVWDLADRPRFSMPSVIAVRGQMCAAFVEKIEFQSEVHLEYIVVVQFDFTGRLRRHVGFDLDDVESAVAELDRLHAEIDA